MRRPLFVSLLFVVALLSGCASVQQMQSAMDEIDQNWGRQKYKILSENGRKVLPMPSAQAERTVIAAAESLGFKKDSANNGLITFKGISPMPFTDEEYKQIRTVEEPMMQAMAATHVGGFTSSFFILSSGDTNTIIFFTLTPQGSDQTVVSIDFRIEWIKGKKQAGMLLGENPPPEAVRRGLDKFWKAVAANS
jgi:hypothetical protein